MPFEVDSLSYDRPEQVVPQDYRQVKLYNLAQVSREGSCNGCWVRAVAFVLWTLCPTDFDFPKGGFS